MSVTPRARNTAGGSSLDPTTPMSAYTFSPRRSPADASNMTPVISNVSSTKKRVSHLLRPSSATRGGKATGGSPPRKSYTQQYQNKYQSEQFDSSNHSRYTDSPTIVTNNQIKFNKIKSKTSEDPPSDISSDSATSSTRKSAEEEPDGSHVNTWKLVEKSPTPLIHRMSETPDGTPKRFVFAISETTTQLEPDIIPNEILSQEVPYSRPPSRERPRPEPVESREDINQQRESPARRASPVRSALTQRPSQKHQPQHQHHPQEQQQLHEKPADVSKVRRYSSSEHQRQDVDESFNQQKQQPTGVKKPLKQVDEILSPKNHESKTQSKLSTLSTYSQHTHHSVNTAGTSTHPSISVQSVETFRSTHPFHHRKNSAESENIFDRAVAQCGDAIYATVAAVATGAQDSNRNFKSKSRIDNGAPMIDEIVANLSDVTGTTQITEKVLPNADQMTCTSTWWISMFQRMKQEHEAELKQWKSDLEIAKEKKIAYKAELKNSIASQLNWLEDKMVNSDRHVNTTNREGDNSSTTETKRAFSSLPSQEGIEVTVDHAAQMRRIQHLEQTLQETIEQHAIDRQQWYTALEEAATVTANGEQLSMKQQEQLLAIKKEAQEAVSRQRLQWKEKTRVLTELLELTEQQHRQEISNWNQEKEKLQKKILALTSEKNEIAVEFDRVLSDMQELTDDADLAFKEAAIQKEQAASALQLCNGFEKQISTALKEAEEFKDQAFKAKDEHNTLQTRLDEVESLLAGTQNELIRWKATAEKALNQVGEINKLKELEQKELIASKHEVHNLKEQLVVARKEEREAKEQATNALKLCSDYEDQMDLTLKDASQWQHEVECAKNDYNALKSENDTNKQEILRTRNEYEALKEKYDSSSQEMVVVQNEIITVKAEKDLLNQEYMQFKECTLEKYQELESTMSLLRSENEAVKEEKRSLQECLNSQSQQAEASKKATEVQIEALKKENENLKEQDHLNKQEIELSNKEIDLFKTEIETIQAEVESSIKETNVIKSELDVTKRELDLKKEELKVTGRELLAVKKEVEAKTSENTKLKKEIVTFKQEVERLKVSVKKSQEEAELARKETTAANKEVAASKKEVEVIRKEIKDLRKQAADFTEQAVSSQKQCLKLQKNLAAASPRDHDSRYFQRSIDRSVKSNFTIEEWEERLDRAIAERDLYKQESNNLSLSLQKISGELEKFKHENDFAAKELEGVRKEIERIRIEREEAVETCERLSMERDSIQQHANMLDTNVATLTQELEVSQERLAFGNSMKNYDHELKKLQNKLVAIEAERDLYKKQAIEAAEAFRKARAQLKNPESLPSVEKADARETEVLRLVEKTQKRSQVSPDAELVRKYQESIIKQNDMENRFKLLELQKSNERGSWKLQLEAALADNRKLLEEKKFLESKLLYISRVKEFVVPLDGDLEDKKKTDIKVLESEINDEVRIVEFEANQRYDVLLNRHRNTVSKLEDQSEAQPSFETVPSILHRLYPNDSTWDESFSTKEELMQTREWKKLMEEVNEHNQQLLTENEELKFDLEQARLLYDKSRSRLERALHEIEDCKEEISFLKRNQGNQSIQVLNDQTIPLDILEKLDSQQQAYVQSIQKLQKDVSSIKEKVDQPTLGTSDNEQQKIKAGLFQIQKSLQELVSELSMEAETVCQYQKTIKEMANEIKLNDDPTKSMRFLEQQQQLVQEVEQLRDHLLRRMESQNAVEDSATRELVAELHRKEASLSALKMELDIVRDKLDAERTNRENSECRNAALKAQVEAYSEELIQLQATNTKLIERFDIRNDSVAEPDSYLYEDIDYSRSRSTSKEDTSPLLDEALALAEGFTDIMKGKANSNCEPSALEMLESLSDMIEKHDTHGRKKLISSYCDESPRHRSRPREAPDYIDVINAETPRSSPSVTRKIQRDVVRQASSAKKRLSLPHCTPLQLLVEQLFDRCEMLERERVRLMEITLDLIESAAGANESQMNEALEIARRRSMDEMTKLKEQSKIDQERIFHKVCTRCIQKDSGGSECKRI